MSEQPHSASHRASEPDDQVREVDGIFFDRQHLNRAVSALVAAGFKRQNMTATLERQDERGVRVAVTDLPSGGFSAADERQLRTLGTSLAGTVAALATAGIVIATGGAALAKVAAAALVGSTAASGVYVAKTLKGFDGVVPSEDVILSVRVNGIDEERRVLEILEQHSAEQIWAQNRPY